MSLWKLREERKKIGAGERRGPGTWTLVVLLVLVVLLIVFLGGIG